MTLPYNLALMEIEILKSAVRAVRKLLSTKQPFPSAKDFDAGWGEICRVLKDAIGEVCEKILKERGNEVGDESRFVHYTSIDAFANMLLPLVNGGDGKTFLRLYDSIHFNDPNEGSFFSLELRNQLLDKHGWWLSREGPEKSEKLLDKHGWRLSRENLEKSKKPHSYIASFVGKKSFDEKFPGKKAEDDLLLWRAYGMDGKGCSLSIPSSRLSKRIKKVRYGDDACKKIYGELQPILCILDPLFKKLDSGTKQLATQVRGGHIIRIVIDSLEPLRYLYKSDAFSHESECRWIHVDEGKSGEKICFDCERRNNAPTRLRHYVERGDLGIRKLLISGSVITLGPCVEYRDNIRYCIESLLKRAEIFGPEIIDSKIAYRSA